MEEFPDIGHGKGFQDIMLFTQSTKQQRVASCPCPRRGPHHRSLTSGICKPVRLTAPELLGRKGDGTVLMFAPHSSTCKERILGPQQSLQLLLILWTICSFVNVLNPHVHPVISHCVTPRLSKRPVKSKSSSARFFFQWWRFPPLFPTQISLHKHSRPYLPTYPPTA